MTSNHIHPCWAHWWHQFYVCVQTLLDKLSGSLGKSHLPRGRQTSTCTSGRLHPRSLLCFLSFIIPGYVLLGFVLAMYFYPYSTSYWHSDLYPHPTHHPHPIIHTSTHFLSISNWITFSRMYYFTALFQSLWSTLNIVSLKAFLFVEDPIYCNTEGIPDYDSVFLWRDTMAKQLL